MPRIQRTKQGQYFITLPKEIINMKGWEKGKVLIVGINKKTGSVELND